MNPSLGLGCKVGNSHQVAIWVTPVTFWLLQGKSSLIRELSHSLYSNTPLCSAPLPSIAPLNTFHSPPPPLAIPHRLLPFFLPPPPPFFCCGPSYCTSTRPGVTRMHGRGRGLSPSKQGNVRWGTYSLPQLSPLLLLLGNTFLGAGARGEERVLDTHTHTHTHARTHTHTHTHTHIHTHTQLAGLGFRVQTG